MFQLIISILAIILAVALAGVSVYYGGSAFSNGSEAAEYATLTNQGAQIEAASTLFRAQEGVTIGEVSVMTDEAAVATALELAAGSINVGTDAAVHTEALDSTNVFQVLVDTSYLKQVPDAGNWTLDTTENAVYKLSVGDAVCAAGTQIDNVATQAATDLAELMAENTGVSGCLKSDISAVGNVFFYSL